MAVWLILPGCKKECSTSLSIINQSRQPLRLEMVGYPTLNLEGGTGATMDVVEGTLSYTAFIEPTPEYPTGYVIANRSKDIIGCQLNTLLVRE